MLEMTAEKYSTQELMWQLLITSVAFSYTETPPMNAVSISKMRQSIKLVYIHTFLKLEAFTSPPPPTDRFLIIYKPESDG